MPFYFKPFPAGVLEAAPKSWPARLIDGDARGGEDEGADHAAHAAEAFVIEGAIGQAAACDELPDCPLRPVEDWLIEGLPGVVGVNAWTGAALRAFFRADAHEPVREGYVAADILAQ